MQREGESRRERESARDGSRQTASLIFFLHIHTTGKNHQHQSSLGSQQTTFKARIGSTLLSDNGRLSCWEGSTPKGVEACPVRTPSPRSTTAGICVSMPVCLAWAHPFLGGQREGSDDTLPLPRSYPSGAQDTRKRKRLFSGRN